MAAIAAIGMKTQLQELATVGLKPVVLMLGETVFLAVAGLAVAALGQLTNLIAKAPGRCSVDSFGRTLRLALAACAALLFCRASRRAAVADQTVRIIAAGPAGGSADIVARLLADALAKELGQPVIVEPKPGAAACSRSTTCFRRRTTATRCWWA